MGVNKTFCTSSFSGEIGFLLDLGERFVEYDWFSHGTLLSQREPEEAGFRTRWCLCGVEETLMNFLNYYDAIIQGRFRPLGGNY